MRKKLYQGYFFTPFIKPLTKLSASFVLPLFVATSLVSSPSVFAAGALPDLKLNAVPAMVHELPAEQGNVTNWQLKSNSKGSFVIHIQDAHANASAQESIRKILHWVDAKRREQGVSLDVAVEGASGKIHPEYFDLVPGHLDAGKAAVKKLAAQGELSGADLFAWDLYLDSQRKPSAKKSTAAVYGAENPELYADNLKSFRRILYEQNDIERLLVPIRTALEREASRVLSPELRTFLRERRLRKLGDYGNGVEVPQWEAWLPYLAKSAKETLSIDLDNRFEQIRFPQLTRILTLQKLNISNSPDDLEDEHRQKETLLRKLKKIAINAEDRSQFEDFNQLEKSLNPRATAEAMVSLAEKYRLSLAEYAAFWRRTARTILSAEIETDLLALEMDQLESAITDKLAVATTEKELVQTYVQLSLLEELLKLEMPRNHFDILKKQSSQVRFLMTRDYLQKSVSQKLAAYEQAARHFYEGALERDQALVAQALKQQKPGGVVVLITGGFHTSGIENILRSKDANFAVVRPAMAQTDHGEAYHRVLKGDNSDLSEYFDQTSLNKQEALFLKSYLETAVPELKKNTSLSADAVAQKTADAINAHPVLQHNLFVTAERINELAQLRITRKSQKSEERSNKLVQAVAASDPMQTRSRFAASWLQVQRDMRPQARGSWLVGLRELGEKKRTEFHGVGRRIEKQGTRLPMGRMPGFFTAAMSEVRAKSTRAAERVAEAEAKRLKDTFGKSPNPDKILPEYRDDLSLADVAYIYDGFEIDQVYKGLKRHGFFLTKTGWFGNSGDFIWRKGKPSWRRTGYDPIKELKRSETRQPATAASTLALSSAKSEARRVPQQGNSTLALSSAKSEVRVDHNTLLLIAGAGAVVFTAGVLAINSILKRRQKTQFIPNLRKVIRNSPENIVGLLIAPDPRNHGKFKFMRIVQKGNTFFSDSNQMDEMFELNTRLKRNSLLSELDLMPLVIDSRPNYTDPFRELDFAAMDSFLPQDTQTGPRYENWTIVTRDAATDERLTEMLHESIAAAKREFGRSEVRLSGQDFVALDKMATEKLTVTGVHNLSGVKDEADKMAQLAALNPTGILIRSNTKVTDDFLTQLRAAIEASGNTFKLEHVIRLGHGLDNVTFTPDKFPQIKVRGTKGSAQSISALALRMTALAAERRLQQPTAVEHDQAPVESFLPLESFRKASAEKIAKRPEAERALLQAKSDEMLVPVSSTALDSLRGRVVGVIGAGNIGEELIARYRELGLEVWVNSRTMEGNPSARPNEKKHRFAEKDEIYQYADFVVVLTGLSPATKGMIGDHAIELMSKNPDLKGVINPDRGKIVDEAAMARLLERKDNRVLYLLDDVPDTEVLRSLALYTDHIGGTTAEAETSIRLIVDDILSELIQRSEVRRRTDQQAGRELALSTAKSEVRSGRQPEYQILDDFIENPYLPNLHRRLHEENEGALFVTFDYGTAPTDIRKHLDAGTFYELGLQLIGTHGVGDSVVEYHYQVVVTEIPESIALVKTARTNVESYLRELVTSGAIGGDAFAKDLANTIQNLEAWLSDPDIDELSPLAKDSVRDAIRSGRWADLIEAFRQQVSFGTAGIRGMAAYSQGELEQIARDGIGAKVLKGPNTINDVVLLKTTAGLIRYMQEQGEHKVVIGYDSRVAGSEFAELIAKAFAGASTADHPFEIHLFDEASPFPELSFAVTVQSADKGILISASHNPSNYNGFKITDRTGAQLTGTLRDAIVAAIGKASLADIKLKNISEIPAEEFTWLGGAVPLPDKNYQGHTALVDMHSLHVAQVKKFIKDPEMLRQKAASVNVGFAAFNGAGNKAVPRLLSELGFTNTKVVKSLQELNGLFPAFGWGEQPDPGDPIAADIAVRAFIDEHGQPAFDALDLLIGTDPDADRAGIIVKVPVDQQAKFGKYKLLSANDAWTLLLWYRFQREADLHGANPDQRSKEYITFSHVTTDALEAVGKHFGITSRGDMLSKQGLPAGGYLEGRRSWVGFSYIAAFADKMRKDGLTNVGGAEESNGFSVLGGPVAPGEVLGAGGHVNDKDGTFAAVLLAEAAAYAKSKGTSLFEMLDEIYRQIGYYATANKPLPRVGAFFGSSGKEKKIRLLQTTQDWLQRANEASKTPTPFKLAGREVIGAVQWQSGRYDGQHYEGFPDEGIRFFFHDPALQPGDDFTLSRNYITIRPSGTSQTIRFYTQFFSAIHLGDNIAELKSTREKEALDAALLAQLELLNASGYDGKDDADRNAVLKQMAAAGITVMAKSEVRTQVTVPIGVDGFKFDDRLSIHLTTVRNTGSTTEAHVVFKYTNSEAGRPDKNFNNVGQGSILTDDLGRIFTVVNLVEKKSVTFLTEAVPASEAADAVVASSATQLPAVALDEAAIILKLREYFLADTGPKAGQKLPDLEAVWNDPASNAILEGLITLIGQRDAALLQQIGDGDHPLGFFTVGSGKTRLTALKQRLMIRSEVREQKSISLASNIELPTSSGYIDQLRLQSAGTDGAALLSNSQRSVARQSSGFYVAPSILAREQGMSWEEAALAVFRVIAEEEGLVLDETMVLPVLKAAREALGEFSPLLNATGESFRLADVVTADQLNQSELVYALAVHVLARPGDQIHLYTTGPDSAQSVDRAVKQLEAILKKVGTSEGYAASRVTFFDASSWDAATLQRTVRRDLGSKQSGLRGALLSARLEFLNAVMGSGIFGLQRQPKNTNAARLISPAMLADSLDEHTVHQIEAWLTSKGMSQRLAERFTAMIAAVRALSEAA